MTVDEKLDKIIKLLEQIEKRQLGFKDHIEENVQGSFGTVDTGKEL